MEKVITINLSDAEQARLEGTREGAHYLGEIKRFAGLLATYIEANPAPKPKAKKKAKKKT